MRAFTKILLKKTTQKYRQNRAKSNRFLDTNLQRKIDQGFFQKTGRSSLKPSPRPWGEKYPYFSPMQINKKGPSPFLFLSLLRQRFLVARET